MATLKDSEGNKVNKYIVESIIQGNYGNGWDDLCIKYKGGLMVYNTNERNVAHRVIKRRSINPKWFEVRGVTPNDLLKLI